MADPIEEEIQQEVKAHKILIYGKGTKTMPMCGFTRETMRSSSRAVVERLNSSMFCRSRLSGKH